MWYNISSVWGLIIFRPLLKIGFQFESNPPLNPFKLNFIKVNVTLFSPRTFRVFSWTKKHFWIFFWKFSLTFIDRWKSKIFVSAGVVYFLCKFNQSVKLKRTILEPSSLGNGALWHHNHLKLIHIYVELNLFLVVVI